MHLSKRFLPVAALAALLAAPMAARAESEFSVVLQGGVTKYNRSLASGSDVGAEYGLRLGFMPSPIAGLRASNTTTFSPTSSFARRTATSRRVTTPTSTVSASTSAPRSAEPV
jgi:hypothetical protein